MDSLQIPKIEQIIEEFVPKRVFRRGLPAELLVEMHKWLPLDFGICILLAVPNALIARYNGPKLKEQISKLNRKVNKWNAPNLMSNVIIEEERLVLNHHGPDNHRHSVQAEMLNIFFKCPLLKMEYISAYFEVEILFLRRPFWHEIVIGFSDANFPKKFKWLGHHQNSVGMSSKCGLAFDDQWVEFEADEEKFREGDVVGIGLAHSVPNSSLKCFSTFNGKLLGSAQLSPNFCGLQLFPTVNLRHSIVKANFGKRPFQFDPHKFLQCGTK